MKMDDTCTVTDAKRRKAQYDRKYVKRVRNEIDNSGFGIKTLSRQAWVLSLIELVCIFCILLAPTLCCLLEFVIFPVTFDTFKPFFLRRMYFTDDLSGQYSVQMTVNSFADIHFIFRCTDFDTKDGGKTFFWNFDDIAHIDTVLTRKI
jgi:hypothetical protein